MIARMRKPVWLIVFVGAFIGLVVWPLLTLPANVFSLGYFRFYVVLTFIILIVAAAIGIFLPIWEARGTVTKLFQWQARSAPLLRFLGFQWFHCEADRDAVPVQAQWEAGRTLRGAQRHACAWRGAGKLVLCIRSWP